MEKEGIHLSFAERVLALEPLGLYQLESHSDRLVR